MNILKHILALTIIPLTFAQEDAGTYGANVLSIGESLEFCLPSISGPINKILGIATLVINKGWSSYSSKHDPFENLVSLSHTVDSGEIIDNIPLKVLCRGTVRKLELKVNVTKVSGFSNLRFEDLTVNKSTGGEGKSCSGATNSGPFRCVYEGSMCGGVSLLGPLESVVDTKATLYCNPLFGRDFTKDINLGDITCNLKEEVSDIEGSYCAGQCSESPFQPVVSEISFDRLGFDVSSLECSTRNDDFDYLLDIIVAAIKRVISKGVDEKILEVMNKLTAEVFPLPTRCRSGNVKEENLRKSAA